MGQQKKNATQALKTANNNGFTSSNMKRNSMKDKGNKEELTAKKELLKDLEKNFTELKEMNKEDQKIKVNKQKNKKIHINTKIIAERCLDPSINWKTLSHDELAEAVLQITHLKLDRLGLEMLENLECYDCTTHAYFQYNNLRELGDQLSFMPNLIFLVAFNNNIEFVDDELANCTKLEVLDLSNNKINRLQLESLPKGLLALNLKGNPVSQDSTFLDQCLTTLSNLIELNEIPIIDEMRTSKKFCLPNETTSNQEKDNLEYDMRQSFESFTIEKLKSLQPKDSSILRSSGTFSKHPSKSYSDKECLQSSNVSFSRPDSEEIEQLEKSRSHNTLTFEQLLIEQKQLHMERQQMLIEEMEQARLEFKKKLEQLLQESRKRRESYKQIKETANAEETNS